MFAFWHNGQQPTPPSNREVLLALPIIVACHFVLAVGTFWWFLGYIPIEQPDAISNLGWDYHSGSDVIRKNMLLAACVLATVGVVNLVIWRLSRHGQSRATSWPWFRRCWAISSVITLAITLAMFGYLQWIDRHAAFALPFILLLLLIGPAAIAPRVLPTAQRWRPVCPECSHAVHYVAAPRCPECGEPHLRPSRYYKRWAIPRVPWERRRRSIPIAWLQTQRLILFRPATAAWRLAAPQQIGRAIRWMLGNVLGLPAAYGLAYLLLFGLSAVSGVDITELRPQAPRADHWPAAHVWSAAIIGLSVWLIAGVLLPPLFGIALAWLAPRIQPAARVGIMKWSLYASGIPVALVLLFSVTPLIAQALLFVPGLEQIAFSYYAWITDALSPIDKLSLQWHAYALWWAAGVASQPYLRHRGFVVFVIAAASYLLFMQIMWRVFDRRGFEGFL